MKSILFLIPSLAVRGAERALVNLVNNLDQKKYQITVQTLFDAGGLRPSLGSNVEYRKGLPWVIRGNVHLLKCFTPSLLYRLIVGKKYDIVVAYLEGTVTRIISGCPYADSKKIAWVHTSFSTPSDFSFCYRNQEEAQRSYSVYDRIVCVSETVKKSILRWVNRPVSVIGNVLESDHIHILAKDVPEEVFSSTSPNVLFVGTIEQNKGLDRLLSVHKRLLEEDLKHNIYIIGEGPLVGWLKSRIRSNGLSDTMHYLGFQPNPYQYMQRADLYVCASYREGLSYTIIEAMLLGKPVVSTACGGPQELLGENSEYGLLTPNTEQGLYDGIRMMLIDPALMLHYSARSKERAGQFSHTNVLALHDKLFEE